MTRMLNGGRIGAAAVVVASAIVCSFHLPANAQCQYEVTAIIQAPECGIFGYPPTIGVGLNDLGHVVGYQYACGSPTNNRAFLWTPEGGYQVLPMPPDVYSVAATDINDNGIITATGWRSGIGQRGFIYDLKTGEWTELPPVNPDSGWSTANAINNAGQVVGYRSLSDGVNPYNAYIWSKEEGFTDLGVMEGPNSSAMAINELGTIAGWTGSASYTGTAYFYAGDEPVFFPMEDALTSYGISINTRNYVVGRVELPDGEPDSIHRAFKWDPAHGTVTILEPLPVGNLSHPHFIAESGLVTGFTRLLGARVPDTATIWLYGDANDLNGLVESEVDASLTGAGRMNRSGQMIAWGRLEGDSLTFLLSPIDPSAADIDGDCDTDLQDLVLLLDDWGSTDSPADLNADGVVNVLDLLFVLAHWG